jgi:response regulator NasT
LDAKHALDMISQIVHEAACPVIALLDAADPAYVSQAAKRGVFAYVIIDDDPKELQSALEITLLRFAEFHNLEGAFGRRATIEQAKGILMERQGITANQAFQQLREHSQQPAANSSTSPKRSSTATDSSTHPITGKAQPKLPLLGLRIRR